MTDTVIDPLDGRVPIVGPDGKPTLYFLRQWLQQYGVNGEVSAEVAALLALQIITEGGIQGGQALSAGDMTLSLTDTGVSAGTYGDSSNVAQITVDEKGRITSAVDVPVSGGGGGSGTAGRMFKDTTQSVGASSLSDITYQVTEGDAEGALSTSTGEVIIPAALAGRPIMLLAQSRATTNPVGFFALEIWRAPTSGGSYSLVARQANDNNPDAALQVSFIDHAPASGTAYIIRAFTQSALTFSGDDQNFFSYMSV
jgi:hypothetical protein